MFPLKPTSEIKETLKKQETPKEYYKILDFESFPPILGQSITLDKNTVIYRSYDTRYLIDKRPTFFGEKHVAERYLTDSRKLSAFVSKRKIKLLDIRYVSHIINQLILLRKNNNDIIEGYMTLALSFGLVSLSKQLELYSIRYREVLKNDERYNNILQYYNKYINSKEKNIWQNPIELQGIRIGETNNDIESIIILKEIFSQYFDGIIFPTMFSPYFERYYIPNEILLFQPLKCVVEVDKNIIETSKRKNVDIKDIIKKNNINVFSVPFLMNNKEHIYFRSGGYMNNTKHNTNYLFKKNNVINEYYNTKKNEVKHLEKVGKMFRNELFDKSTLKKINYMDERNKILDTMSMTDFKPFKEWNLGSLQPSYLDRVIYKSFIRKIEK